MRTGLSSTTALAFVWLASSIAVAQDFGAPFSGFSSSSDKPIQIEADSLEVHDPEKLAIYSGHVRVLQGDTLLEAPELRIFYKGKASTGAVSGSQVDRIEAGPGVTVHAKDQVASGDRAVFDMASDMIVIEGNVLLTQGQNIVHGQKLIVNLKTKQGRIEGGRVQTLIAPTHGGPIK